MEKKLQLENEDFEVLESLGARTGAVALCSNNHAVARASAFAWGD